MQPREVLLKVIRCRAAGMARTVKATPVEEEEVVVQVEQLEPEGELEVEAEEEVEVEQVEEEGVEEAPNDRPAGRRRARHRPCP